jgi:glycosyltransferase involved in cell wall biosynthesis
MKPKKICIVGLDDYPMLTGDSSFGYTGGESVQHVLLARAWRDLGMDVSIVVYDYGQPRVTLVDGIRAIASFRRDAGLRGLRFFHPRMSGVWAALREANADIYYHSPASPWAGVTAAFASSFDRRFVLRIASDSDCRRGEQPMRFARDRWLFDYGVRKAALVAAQTEHQRELLRRYYGVSSEVLPIAVDVPRRKSHQPKDIDVLWVGNLRRVKRPDVLIELARRRPQYRFVLVGGSVPNGLAYFDEIAARAAQLPNLTMAGGIPYADVGGWFDRARLHVNTSDYEGFPNTFLQAWVRGVPVVSFFDPDGLIERRGLGCRVGDVDEMCTALDALLTNEGEREAIGERAREFVSNQYAAREIALRYLELLERPGAAFVHDRSIGTARDL